MELIRHIKASNILSFGPNGLDLPLGSLNVLIGANGSGKSNFLELLALMRATPSEIHPVISPGGGIWEWIWKGKPNGEAEIEVLVDYPVGEMPLRHKIIFEKGQERFRLVDEKIENERPQFTHQNDVKFHYRYQRGKPYIFTNDEKRSLKPDTVATDASILAQRSDPEFYPELTYLANAYKKILLYREWSFGRNSKLRDPQASDQRNDRLDEDFLNLGVFLNRLRRDPKTKNAMFENLRDLYDGLTDFEINIVEGGYVQVLFSEGNFTIPSTRLSDGSLRYLCLLAILLDPTPPPLICIEEPELGLHPDIIHKIADLLVSAAERTQLIVTTHSRMLIDAMSDQPENVIVCSKTNGQSNFERLNAAELSEWLDKYSLGDLWSMGEIGGNRW